MISHFNEHLQNPIFDALLCDEDRLEDDFNYGFGLKEPEIDDFNQISKDSFTFFEHDVFWEDNELVSLLSKEMKQACLSYEEIDSDGSLKTFRNEGIKWMLKVVSRYGFTAMTAILAVNYYDRFLTSSCFQKDKPWMNQLAAVACLSIAAKVEETHVPLLLHFQVEDCKHVFEAKTIQRMELLVLSTLGWKMNPVTPISFFDHIVRRFELTSNPHWEFLRKCESIVLSIINDCRVVNYLPSVIAAATMLYVVREIKPCDALEYQNQFMNLLKTSKEKFDDCHKLIMEAMEDHSSMLCHKRKHEAIQRSPSGVIDSYFSSESSNDFWASASVTSSVSSSPEPLFKRTRSRNPQVSTGGLSF